MGIRPRCDNARRQFRFSDDRVVEWRRLVRTSFRRRFCRHQLCSRDRSMPYRTREDRRSRAINMTPEENAYDRLLKPESPSQIEEALAYRESFENPEPDEPGFA